MLRWQSPTMGCRHRYGSRTDRGFVLLDSSGGAHTPQPYWLLTTSSPPLISSLHLSTNVSLFPVDEMCCLPVHWHVFQHRQPHSLAPMVSPQIPPTCSAFPPNPMDGWFPVLLLLAYGGSCSPPTSINAISKLLANSIEEFTLSTSSSSTSLLHFKWLRGEVLISNYSIDYLMVIGH